MIVAGWIVSILPSAMLLMSGVMKLTHSEDVSKGFEHLGFPDKLALILGIVEIAATLIYLIPRTSVLGAILLTGYLGGAIATHARLLETQFAGPLVFGILVWLGLFLRDSQVRALIPIRRT
jgi:uncharacterized membrane protein YphA (DoxX/SURF4 family)